MAERFAAARRLNTTAAVNKYVRYREIQIGESAVVALVSGREYQSLELSRLGNVPPYLAGAPAGIGCPRRRAMRRTRDRGRAARASLRDEP
jgi:hypothetical protein